MVVADIHSMKLCSARQYRYSNDPRYLKKRVLGHGVGWPNRNAGLLVGQVQGQVQHNAPHKTVKSIYFPRYVASKIKRRAVLRELTDENSLQSSMSPVAGTTRIIRPDSAKTVDC